MTMNIRHTMILRHPVGFLCAYYKNCGLSFSRTVVAIAVHRVCYNRLEGWAK